MRQGRQRRPAIVNVPACTGTGAASFVGGGTQNVAAGSYSAVLGGDNNDACSYDDAIGGGVANGISGAQAFIGGGYLNGSAGIYAFIGAGVANAASGDGAFVGAGDKVYFNLQGGYPPQAGNVAYGEDSFVGAGDLNKASGQGSFVGAGGSTYAATGGKLAANQVAGADSFIGAGDLNTINGSGSFIGAGGYLNPCHFTCLSNYIYGTDSFIGAGDINTIVSNDAFIGGGLNNNIDTGGTYAAIAGGDRNTASGPYGAVAGGYHNSASASAAAVGGGSSSSATGKFATIPGGYLNAAAGTGSFAAGTQAKARHDGAFVWSDDNGTAEVQSTAPYQFVARASGGFFLFTDAASKTGVRLNPGSGAWASLSDRTMKTGVTALDDAAVLAKVTALPVSEWSYTSEHGVRHVGPMAQDFYAAFRVGEDDRHITSIDEDGVALAAIKALAVENRGLRERLARDKTRFARDEAQLARVKVQRARDAARLLALEHKVDALAAR
jgi:hypothetical protein